MGQTTCHLTIFCGMRCYDICQMKIYTYLCTRTYSYIKISIACHLYLSEENIPDFFIYSFEYTEKGKICTFVQYIHKTRHT
jgi:hypothetical protein